jgi:hypothetical protein
MMVATFSLEKKFSRAPETRKEQEPNEGSRTRVEDMEKPMVQPDLEAKSGEGVQKAEC